MLSREFGSGLPLDGLLADLQHGLDLARDAESPAPLSALARGIWATTRVLLGPGQDHTRLVRWLEQITKTDLCG